MAVEIEFPFEFVVSGRPASLQAKRKDSIAEWKKRVKQASYAKLPEGHFAAGGPISVTMFYFPETEMQGDIDNIVKPVLDALCRHVYMDDKQVERIWVQKFEPEKLLEFASPSGVLVEAISGDKPLLYVRLSDDPSEGLT